MQDTQRFTMRAAPEDLANIDAIADALRTRGLTRYPTRTDAVRFALDSVARDVAKDATHG